MNGLSIGSDKLEKLPPQLAPSGEIHALKAKMAHTVEGVRLKNSSLTVQDLKRLLFRCAATLISLEKVGPTFSSYMRQLSVLPTVST